MNALHFSFDFGNISTLFFNDALRIGLINFPLSIRLNELCVNSAFELNDFTAS